MGKVNAFACDWVSKELSTCSLGTLLDIGSRNSALPAVLAAAGHDVVSLERDTNFVDAQKSHMVRHNTSYVIKTGELLHMDIQCKFDYITAIYALQHNVNTDVECYEMCATLCNKGLLIVNEYNYSETKYDLGRGDGDMRIYSNSDVCSRIIDPIVDIKGEDNTFVRAIFAKADFRTQDIAWSNPIHGNIVLISFSFLTGEQD